MLNELSEPKDKLDTVTVNGPEDVPDWDATPHHERRRRHRRDLPRLPILHPQLPRHPPPGHQPGGLFPLKHSPPHSPKPPTKSPNDPTPHDGTEHIPEWSKDTEPTTTASNAPPTTANSTTAHPRSTSSKSPAKLNGIERTASTCATASPTETWKNCWPNVASPSIT